MVTAVVVEPPEPAVDAATVVCATDAAALVVVAADAVVVAGVVVVVAALVTAAACAVGLAVEDAERLCDEELAAALAARTSDTVAVALTWLVAPRLPSPYTAPHMPASRIRASAPTRRRRTFVRRARALRRRATSGEWRGPG